MRPRTVLRGFGAEATGSRSPAARPRGCSSWSAFGDAPSVSRRTTGLAVALLLEGVQGRRAAGWQLGAVRAGELPARIMCRGHGDNALSGAAAGSRPRITRYTA